VEEEVKSIIRKAACSSGFILSSANMFTADMPVENILSVYCAVKKHSAYSIKKPVLKPVL
jgi:hypothetical protein